MSKKTQFFMMNLTVFINQTGAGREPTLTVTARGEENNSAFHSRM